MTLIRSKRALAAVQMLLVVGMFVVLGGSAYAQAPPPAFDQYGTKIKRVAIAEEAQQPETEVEAEQSALPDTGLSLLGTALAGGTLVALGFALRRRERGNERLDD